MAGQVVQITIDVTDGNAAEAVQQVVAQLNAIGPAGEAAGAEAGAGLDQVGDHALSARENVRLLNDDLGLRVPRAMQAVIANSEMLSGAIAGIGSVLIGVGFVDIFAHMGEAVYNLYEKYLDVGAAADDYFKKLGEQQDKDFVNPHSIETAIERWHQATEAVQQYRHASADLSKPASFGWSDVANMALGPMGGINAAYDAFDRQHMAKANEDQAYKSQEQADELSRRQLEMQHELAGAQTDITEAVDGSLKGYAKITAEQSVHIEQIKEKVRYQEKLDNLLNTTQGAVRNWTPDVARSTPLPPDLMETAQIGAAQAKANAERLELERQYTQEVIAMQNEAANAGLAGNALRASQEAQEIDAVLRKYREGEIDKRTWMAETAAIDEKFGAQAAKLQEQLDEQTKHLSDEANQTGMKGLQLVSAQFQTELDAINAAEKKAVGPGGVETPAQSNDFNSQRDSARQMFYQKGVEEQQQYDEKIQSLLEQSDDFEMQGYARIAAESKKRLDEMAQADEAYYGVSTAAEMAFWNQAIQVEADADRQREQLHQKTMQELLKEEQQTARELLPEWQQSLLAIEDQYQDRVHQIQQDLKQNVMSEQEAAAATQAAWQQAYTQMQKSEEETRDKLASGLQSLFEHPEKFFEDAAMKSAFQLMANEMMPLLQSSGPMGGILQYMFGMGPEMGLSRNPGNALGSLFGHGDHSAGGLGSTTNPATMQFEQGTSTLLSGSQMLLQASTALQSAASTMSMGGGGGGGFGGLGTGLGNMDTGGAGASASFPSGMGDGGFDMLGSTSGASAPALSGLSGMGNGGFDMLGSTGSQASAAAGGTTGTLGSTMGVIGGGLMGATSIFSAYQDSNPIAGAVGGGMGGMEAGSSLGMMIGGPAGALVGGVIGGIAGAIGGILAGVFGDKGKSQAEGLDVNTVQPEISKDMQEYETGQAGYSAIAMDLSNLLTSAHNSTTQWGSGARNYFNSNIQPEINLALSSLQKQEAAGRSAVTLSAGQFHGGGWTGDFGDLATSEDEGFIHARANEFVVQPQAAMAHAPLLSAINTGNVSYSSQVQPRMPASSGGGGGSVTIQALDSKSVAQWAKAGGARSLISAINQGQTQYSGIGR